ncbi:hypothetical protein OG352_06015 [Streptomyces sp. NBC_01485]|uniref:hypothetical protein n=1 Tax=Streptomyces sp. NBC_01485 TaxID=2903884 RepID=UPI002E309A3F|nr:hypothetical protein [Streptomyces sp. NBC_01485]
MKRPFVTRARHAAALAETERIRSERDQFKTDRNAAQAAARTAARQFAEADEERTALTLVNARLTDDLTTAREQLAEARALLSDGAIAEVRAQARRDKRRADRLQKELDDATFLPVGGIEQSQRWQPGYVDPKAGTS